MTRLLLLRHADHDLVGRALAGRGDTPLNAHGRAQANALVERLAPHDIHALYASPRPRAQQTIAPLAAALGLHIATAPEFDEVDFGEWTGLSFEHLREHGGEAWRIWCERRGSAQPPGGERFAQVAARARAGFQRLRDAHPDQCVLVVSHSDVLRALVAMILGVSLDDLERFEIAPATISIVDAVGDWAQLKQLNA